MASVYEDVLTQARAQLAALALTGIGSNVLIRKLPSLEEEVDTTPLLCVVPSDSPEGVTRIDFEGNRRKAYHFDAAFITPGGRGTQASGNADPNRDLFRHAEWRAKVVDLFYDPTTLSSVVPQVRNTLVMPGKPVDRETVNQGYDYMIISVDVITKE